jgi:hypothetical protein
MPTFERESGKAPGRDSPPDAAIQLAAAAVLLQEGVESFERVRHGSRAYSIT